MSSEQISSSVSRAENRSDPGWKYCKPVNEGNTNTIRCNFCEKVTKGGITRAKHHLMGKKGNVAACRECPPKVRAELWKLENDKKKIDIRAIRDISSLGCEESEDDADTLQSRSTGKNVATMGPMDLCCRIPEVDIEKKKKNLRQTSMTYHCEKFTKDKVHQYIARFWYQAGLSFDLIKMKSFEDMVTAIGSYGPHLPVPSYHDLTVPLLKKELEYTEELLKDHKEQWGKHGCSIMLDAWTDRKQMCVINFLVNSPAGTMFVRSIDGSNFVKTGEKLFELLDSLVEEIGEENVVQVITDNGSNYVLAGKLLEQKRPNLYWTPCAARCVDLMLEDIGNVPLIKKTIQRGLSLVGFIYSHSSTLSLLRCCTNNKELVRHAVTRITTLFLSLERIHQEKENIQKMFTSDEWSNNKLSEEAKGKQATKIVLMHSFWDNVLFTLKVMIPLVQVFRLIDGERKPTMGYIYEAMDKAKEAIMKSFNNDESKYKDVFAIIDKRWTCQLHRSLHAAGYFLNPEFFYANPHLEFDLEVTNGLYDCIKRLVPSRDVQQKILMELPIYKSANGLFGCDFAKSQRKTIAPSQWWRMYGHSTPNLQQFAIKILNLTCSASGCERNWSVFEQIHSKKRNRLDQKKMHDLIYIKYNQQLKQRHDVRDEIDPIALDDIDECNEWLVGEMDDDEDVRADLVFEDEDLNGQKVLEASGVGEPRTYTRQRTGKRKQPSSSVGVGNASKKGQGKSSKSKGKEKDVPVNLQGPQ